MTATDPATAHQPPRPSRCTRLTAEEIDRRCATARRRGPGRRHDAVRLRRARGAAQGDVLAFRAGDPIDRRVRVLLLDRATGIGTDLVVSLTERRRRPQTSRSTAADRRAGADPRRGVRGHRGDPARQRATGSRRWRKRGIDPAKVRAVPLSAGVFGHEDEVGPPHRARARRSTRPTRPTCRGRTRSTASSPTSTSPSARSRRWSTTIELPVPAERGEWNADTARRRPPAPTSSRSRSPSPRGRASPSTAT